MLKTLVDVLGFGLIIFFVLHGLVQVFTERSNPSAIGQKIIEDKEYRGTITTYAISRTFVTPVYKLNLPLIGKQYISIESLLWIGTLAGMVAIFRLGNFIFPGEMSPTLKFIFFIIAFLAAGFTLQNLALSHYIESAGKLGLNKTEAINSIFETSKYTKNKIVLGLSLFTLGFGIWKSGVLKHIK